MSLYTLIQYVFPSTKRSSGPGDDPLTRTTLAFVMQEEVYVRWVTLRTASGTKPSSWQIVSADA